MTAQEEEILILDGKEIGMAYCPDVPSNHPRIEDKDPYAGPYGTIFGSCSANLRGYVGTWAIKHKKLYLEQISGRFELLGDQPLFADWVTATLRIREGKLLQYHHIGFASIYEFNTFIEVEKGLVVDKKTVNNREAMKPSEIKIYCEDCGGDFTGNEHLMNLHRQLNSNPNWHELAIHEGIDLCIGCASRYVPFTDLQYSPYFREYKELFDPD